MKKVLFLMSALFICTILSVKAQVESGLPVPLSLAQSISSKYLQKGDLVKFNVSSEVYDSSGELVIPEGSVAYGTISKKHVRKIFGKGASMEIMVDYVSLPDGNKIPIMADNLMTKGKTNKLTRTLGYIGCVWLITLPCAFVKGGHAVLEEGTSIQAFTK